MIDPTPCGGPTLAPRTHEEAARLIGRTVRWSVPRTDRGSDGLQILATIADVRWQYGRVDVRVVPTVGIGDRWVSFTQVVLVDHAP